MRMMARLLEDKQSMPNSVCKQTMQLATAGFPTATFLAHSHSSLCN